MNIFNELMIHWYIIFFAVEICATLLSRDLKRNLFNLFATWCGPYSKPLGIASAAMEEDKLQFSALNVLINLC